MIKFDPGWSIEPTDNFSQEVLQARFILDSLQAKVNQAVSVPQAEAIQCIDSLKAGVLAVIAKSLDTASRHVEGANQSALTMAVDEIAQLLETVSVIPGMDAERINSAFSAAEFPIKPPENGFLKPDPCAGLLAEMQNPDLEGGPAHPEEIAALQTKCDKIERTDMLRQLSNDFIENACCSENGWEGEHPPGYCPKPGDSCCPPVVIVNPGPDKGTQPPPGMDPIDSCDGIIAYAKENGFPVNDVKQCTGPFSSDPYLSYLQRRYIELNCCAPSETPSPPPVPSPPAEEDETAFQYELWVNQWNSICMILPAGKTPEQEGKWIKVFGPAALPAVVAYQQQVCSGPPDSVERGDYQTRIPSLRLQGDDLCDWLQSAGAGDDTGVTLPLSYLLGFRKADGKETNVVGETRKAGWWPENWWGQVWLSIGATLYYLDTAMVSLCDYFTKDDTADVKRMGLYRILTGIVNDISGGAFQREIRTQEYKLDYAKPSVLPAVNEANALFISGKISYNDWQCLTRANGKYEHFEEKLMDSQKSKLTALELVQLKLRAEANGEDFDLKARMRELGYMDQSSEETRELANWYPGPQDLLRLMLRDVENPNVLGNWKLEDEWFEENYTGDLKKWGEYAGIPDVVMKYLGRAHWMLPSSGHAFSFLPRLNFPDTPEEVKTNVEDVRTLLKQNDMSPQWIDRMIAISHPVIGMRDARRSYDIGAINAEQLKRIFQERGYTEKDADNLVEFSRKLKERRFSTGATARLYRDGGLNYKQAKDLLIEEGASVAEAEAAIGKAVVQAKARIRVNCQRALKKRYFMLEFTNAEAQAELMGIGMDRNQAEMTVDAWQCELDSQGKQLSISQLCESLYFKIIDEAEMDQRLKRLKLDEPSRAIILNQCLIKNVKKEQKEEEAIKNKADRLSRYQERAARARARAARAKEKTLANAAVRIAKKMKVEVDVASDLINEAIKDLKADKDWSDAELVLAIDKASMLVNEANVPSLLFNAREILQGLLELFPEANNPVLEEPVAPAP